MLSTFRATIRMLLRTPSALVWGLAFPIILATMFIFMFSGFRTAESINAVPVAVVADDAWNTSTFSQVMDALAEGEEPLLSCIEVADEGSALELLSTGEVDGVFMVDESAVTGNATAALDGPNPVLALPRLVVASEDSAAHGGANGDYEVNRSILVSIANSYAQSEALIDDLAASNSAALADPEVVARALSLDARTERVSLTRSTPDETVRFYYALMGMTTLFAAQLSMLAVASIRPTASAVSARRCIAGTSRIRQLAGALLGSWLLSFAFLTVAFAYIRLVVGIDFQGREALCILGVAVGAWLATGIGAIVGSLPLQGGARAGSGILTGLTCGLAIFAGLYGQPTMELADAIARAVPLSTWVNPAKLICDLFYSLYYYESLAPYLARLAACAAWGVAFFAFAAPMFRRQRYAHL